MADTVNKEELRARMREAVDTFVDLVEQKGLDDGTIDLSMTHCIIEREQAVHTSANALIVRHTDGRWVIDDTHTNVMRYPV